LLLVWQNIEGNLKLKAMKEFFIEGNIVDVVHQSIRKGRVFILDGRIQSIEYKDVDSDFYLLPGLIDAHVHIESSMLVPSEFARLASAHGTTATVSDPHEIANVLGLDGVRFMIENGRKVPFHFNFGAPSCVPATPFETAGAELGPEELEELLKTKEIKYLSEMMNFPGVLNHDELVMKKLTIAKKYNKPIDGHAPGVLGEAAKAYADAGITTDHECFTIEEARDKIAAGMKVQIREGSAAKNFEALVPLLETDPDMLMFCSDDKHPNDLVRGHINLLVKRAIEKGYDPMAVLRACTYIPVKHYQLESGLLQPGDFADFILVDSLSDFNVLQTYYKGHLIASEGISLIERVECEQPNNFHAEQLSAKDLFVEDKGKEIKVFEALDGQLITNALHAPMASVSGNIVSDTENDILKIVVLNRYKAAKPAIGFVKNFGFKKGAIASSVAHDSHNIIAVGCSDEEIAQAINEVIKAKGGVSLVSDIQTEVLSLPIAGLMSSDDAYSVAERYEYLDKAAKELGSKLNAPYMTLSFMALLVIPELKLSDLGLFDGNSFAFTDINF